GRRFDGEGRRGGGILPAKTRLPSYERVIIETLCDSYVAARPQLARYLETCRAHDDRLTTIVQPAKRARETPDRVQAQRLGGDRRCWRGENARRPCPVAPPAPRGHETGGPRRAGPPGAPGGRPASPQPGLVCARQGGRRGAA